MATVSISVPANNGDQFPATITGDYSVAIGGGGGGGGGVGPGGGGSPPPVTIITVTIKEEPNGMPTNHSADGEPSSPGGSSGTWSLPKPNGLAQNKTYRITASLDGASDTKTGIQN